MRAAALVLVGHLASWPVAAQTAAPSPEAVARGEYLFNAGGCRGCHTDEKNKGGLLAGGRAIQTPFGTFYGPNITPDPVHGIGRWSDADFIRALKEGLAPDGTHYYPAFPYTSFARMSEQDMRDLKAYIFTVPPIAKESRAHELRFPYNIRLGVAFWKFLNFEPNAWPTEAAGDNRVQRGRYLVEALGHCAECHTPRDITGGLTKDKWMAGASDGAEGERTPNITPDPKTGIGEWSEEDIAFALKMGMKPDGDSLGSIMAEVVQNSTSKLRDDDLAAIAAYLRSLPPIENAPGKR